MRVGDVRSLKSSSSSGEGLGCAALAKKLGVNLEELAFRFGAAVAAVLTHAPGVFRMAFAQLKEKERGFFNNINACLGPIHTRHFGIQYCDKKILR